MSGASVDSSILLAAAQRSKEESERAARSAAEELKEAKEMLEISKGEIIRQFTSCQAGVRVSGEGGGTPILRGWRCAYCV